MLKWFFKMLNIIVIEFEIVLMYSTFFNTLMKYFLKILNLCLKVVEMCISNNIELELVGQFCLMGYILLL